MHYYISCILLKVLSERTLIWNDINLKDENVNMLILMNKRTVITCDIRLFMTNDWYVIVSSTAFSCFATTKNTKTNSVRCVSY